MPAEPIGDGRWVGTWATSPLPVDEAAFNNQTLRMIARTSLGGPRLRVRFSNACGRAPLVLGRACIALRAAGGAIVPGSGRAVRFGGRDGAVVAAGAPIVSDPVDLAVPAGADLAVSLHLPGRVDPAFGVTGHGNARQTGYVSPPGDFADAVEMPGARPTGDLLFLGGIEVVAPPQAGAVVAFGDSLTDGNISTVDGFHRWPDRLARRLAARAGGRPMGVMNHGIGGNRILHDQRGESGLRRFDRDVVAQPGATHAIVVLGINDIRNRYGRAEEVVTAEAMIAGLDQLARRGRAAGITMIGGTLLTFEHETFNPGFYTPEGEAKRQAVNAWIRTAGAFDAVVDFEAALRDPDHPTRMLPQWDCGDHLHPSDAGYERMGDCIDLALFD